MKQFSRFAVVCSALVMGFAGAASAQVEASKCLVDAGCVKPNDPKAPYTLQVTGSDITLPTWTGKVTWVQLDEKGTKVTEFASGKEINIKLPTNISPISHNPIDAKAIANMPNLRKGAYNAAINGKDLVVDQFVVGNFPEFEERIGYQVQAADGTESIKPGPEYTSLTLMLITADSALAAKQTISSGEASYRGMYDMDAIEPGETKQNKRDTAPVAYRIDLPGPWWCSKEGDEGIKGGFAGIGGSRVYRAHQRCWNNDADEYNDIFYNGTVTMTLPMAQQDGNVTLAFGRTHTKDDPKTEREQPWQFFKVALPHKALTEKDHAVLVTSFAEPFFAVLLKAK